VEEKILLASFDLDESEALVGESSYCACLHVSVLQLHLITIKCRRLKVEIRRNSSHQHCV
jgi:hypothetical protein